MFLCTGFQARNQTFLEGGSKFGMVTQMKWGPIIVQSSISMHS